MITNWNVGDPASDLYGLGEVIGTARSTLLDFIQLNGAFGGSVLMLNLLIAMMAYTHRHVIAAAQLEVNFIRIKKSYSASKDVWLMQPPLVIVVGVAMAIWLLVDLLVALCTANKKMINERILSPLNRRVFVAGDLIEFEVHTRYRVVIQVVRDVRM